MTNPVPIGCRQILPAGTPVRVLNGSKGIIVSHRHADGVVVHTVKITHVYRARRYRPCKPVMREINYSFIVPERDCGKRASG